MKTRQIFTNMVIVSSLVFNNVAVATSSSCFSFYKSDNDSAGVRFTSRTSKTEENISVAITANGSTKITSRLIKSLQAVKPGDFVSYTVRNPYGNDPNYLQPEVGVFERLADNGKTAVISGTLNNIARHLVGGIKILRSADSGN